MLTAMQCRVVHKKKKKRGGRRGEGGEKDVGGGFLRDVAIQHEREEGWVGVVVIIISLFFLFVAWGTERGGDKGICVWRVQMWRAKAKKMSSFSKIKKKRAQNFPMMGRVMGGAMSEVWSREGGLCKSSWSVWCCNKEKEQGKGMPGNMGGITTA